MHLHPLVSRAVSKAFAATSGLTLLVLLFTIPIVASVPWWAAGVRLQDLSLPAFFVVLSLSIAYGCATGFIPAIALARFALRIWPLDASEVPRRHCIVWQRRLGYSAGIGVVLSEAVSLVMEGYFSPGASAEGRAIIWYIGSVTCGVGVTIGGAAAISSWAHSHPGYFRRQTFLVYLRRFSGFADRTIIAEVLKAAPCGSPVVFIASPQSAARNWDPFVWAFAGLRLRRPLRSLPVQLRTSDAEWEQAIATLAAEAGMVVMDITERSASVEKEIDMVAGYVQPERVLYLTNRRPMLPAQEKPATPPQIAGGGHLVYERRWAWFPLVMKIGLFALVGYEVFVWTLALPKMASGQNEINVTLLFALIAIMGLWLLVAAVLLLRPSIDGQARQILQQRLAQGATPSDRNKRSQASRSAR